MADAIKVKMRGIMSGPQGNFHPGEIHTLPKETAEALIMGGYAVSAEPETPEAKRAEPEAPVAPPAPAPAAGDGKGNSGKK